MTNAPVIIASVFAAFLSLFASKDSFFSLCVGAGTIGFSALDPFVTVEEDFSGETDGTALSFVVKAVVFGSSSSVSTVEVLWPSVSNRAAAIVSVLVFWLHFLRLRKRFLTKRRSRADCTGRPVGTAPSAEAGRGGGGSLGKKTGLLIEIKTRLFQGTYDRSLSGAKWHFLRR